MNFIAWVLLISGICYVSAGIYEAHRDSYWWFGFWSCYAAANFFWLKATNAI